MTTSTLHEPLPVQAGVTDRQHRLLKQLMWLYLLLLLFEGALRKWFLPALQAPLLIVRDPLALLILLQAANRHLRLLNPYTLVIFFTTILSFLMTFLDGHQNLFVALYGMRITVLHFPLIFVMGQIFDRSDVERMGSFLLWVAPFMTVLIALQFYSPQSAWVNRAVGGGEGGGFDGAMGYFRPPGTFSFTNGTTLFFSLTSVFVFYFWQATRKVNFLILVAASVGILVAIPLAISRGYLFQLVITAFFFVVGSLVGGGRAVGRLGIAAVVLPVLLLILSGFDFVQNGITVFADRFTKASLSEGGLEGTLGDRFIGGMISAVGGADELPFWGQGLGKGTIVGATLLTGSSSTFLVAEGEWGRIIGEMGALLGILTVFTRVILAVHCAVRSVFYVFTRRPLPWLLTSVGLIQIITANWSQPTALGFAIITAGLLVASFNDPVEETGTYAA
ncbi:hypothetical protein GGR26_003213 [Lewinella marina]|uniref:Uncharacterized protein n=1 Tax=Neolewinella marina TaxID=438751 RepID=A0A2G0CE54_9BACT|nr:hypothetical protein [Neolewinella marina]NJB87433.1 hypothetical protein [Neolewinella marina]PHK98258.1 hypothetical protein CGL56_11175 [Neolewinella marina]